MIKSKKSEREHLKMKNGSDVSKHGTETGYYSQIMGRRSIYNGNSGDRQAFVPIIDPSHFGSMPVSTYCPMCRFPITTKSTKNCNCCSLICCIFCFSNWLCFQYCAKKEMTCNNYVHTCPKCGFIIGNYNAC